jgi:RNA polymerase-binding transcription factor DksA
MTRSTVSATRGDPLTDSQLAVLRGMLEQQRRFRRDQLNQLQTPGEAAALSTTDQEIATSLVTAARAALHDVEEALTRMAAGSYGVCKYCGTDLLIERLEVLPQVSLCMPCQRAEQVAD